MPIYTFDAFIDVVATYHHNKGCQRDELIIAVLDEEGLTHQPKFVVDHIDRVGDDADRDHLFGKRDLYNHVDFQDWVYISPDESTAYFENANDALLFFLASS